MVLPKLSRENRPVLEIAICVGLLLVGAAAFAWAALRASLFASLVLTAVAVQLVLVFHDAMHGSLFRSHRANQCVGRLIGAFYLSPYHFLQWSHLEHHRQSGCLSGDTEVLHPVPGQRPWLSLLARSPLAPVLFAPLLQLSHLLALPKMVDGRRARLFKDSLGDGAAMLLLWGTLGPWLHAHGVLQSALVFGFAVPFAASMSLVYLAASPLHTGMAAHSVAGRLVQERPFFVSRTVEGGWLTRTFFCNLNYHIEHHLFAHLPRWQLGRVARALRGDLLAFARDRGLPVIIHPSYLQYYRESLGRVPRYNQVTDVAAANAHFTLVRQ